MFVAYLACRLLARHVSSVLVELVLDGVDPVFDLVLDLVDHPFGLFRRLITLALGAEVVVVGDITDGLFGLALGFIKIADDNSLA